MKIPLLNLCLCLLLFSLFAGCNEKNNPLENGDEDEIPVTSEINYQYLSSAPIHTQTSMLAGHQNKLYRFGSRWPVQVLDLSGNQWSQVQLPDSSYWRWDGATVTIGDTIFVVAVSIESGSYDILKLDLSALIFSHTGMNLPRSFHYPAYGVYNNKIFFLSKSTTGTYEYNPADNTLTEVSSNPFYSENDFSMDLSSGMHGNYFYVFGTKGFFRMDLENYTWENLDVPEQLKTKYLLGSVFGDRFWFLSISDTTETFQYSFTDTKWYRDTSKVLLLPRYSNGGLAFAEWSFWSDGEALYATEISSESVWKITTR